MYLCICNAIRESDVRDAVEGGAASAAEYFRATGVRPQCGRCVRDVQTTIESIANPPVE